MAAETSALAPEEARTTHQANLETLSRPIVVIEYPECYYG